MKGNCWECYRLRIIEKEDGTLEYKCYIGCTNTKEKPCDQFKEIKCWGEADLECTHCDRFEECLRYKTEDNVVFHIDLKEE